jgi:hypothetical protein
MTAKLTPVNRVDALDREAFRQMLESEVFGAVQARIAAELKRAEEVCVRSDSEIEIRRAQGAVTALRAALGTPARILEEMRRDAQ